jgi:hypothetical protein
MANYRDVDTIPTAKTIMQPVSSPTYVAQALAGTGISQQKALTTEM